MRLALLLPLGALALLVDAAAGILQAGNLTFNTLPGAATVSHADTWPVGRWGGDLNATVTAATSVVSLDLLITAAAPTNDGAVILTAQRGATGATAWTADATDLLEAGHLHAIDLRTTAAPTDSTDAIAVAAVGEYSLSVFDATTGSPVGASIPLPKKLMSYKNYTAAAAPQLLPMTSHTFVFANGTVRPTLLVASRDRAALYVVTVNPMANPLGVLSVAATVTCPGGTGLINHALHGGASFVVAHCNGHIVRLDLASGVTEVVSVNGVAVATWREQTSNVLPPNTTASERAPHPTATAAIVYVAAYSSMSRSVVVAVANFAAGAIAACGSRIVPVDIDSSSVMSLVVLGDSESAPILVVQTATAVVGFIADKSQGPAVCKFDPHFEAGFTTIVQAAVQQTPKAHPYLVVDDVAPLTWIPSLQGNAVFALRVAVNFVLIDAALRQVIWYEVSEVHDGIHGLTDCGYPRPVRGSSEPAANPLVFSFSGASRTITLGCATRGVAVSMPGPELSTMYSTSFGFSIFDARKVRAVPLLTVLADTVIRFASTSAIMTAPARSIAFEARADTAFLISDGALTTMNAIDAAEPAIRGMTGLGIDGSLSAPWRQSSIGIPSTGNTKTAVLMSFSQYIVFAPTGGSDVTIYNAVTSDAVTVLTVPPQCGTIVGGAVMDTAFAEHQRNGLATDPSVSKSMIIVAKPPSNPTAPSCVAVVNAALELTAVAVPAQANRVFDLNATHVAVIDALHILSIIDTDKAAVTQQFLPQILDRSADEGHLSSWNVALCGNVVVVSTQGAASAFLADTGAHLWTTTLAVQTFKTAPVCAGPNFVIAASSSVRAYAMAPKPRDPSLSTAVESAPQQLAWNWTTPTTIPADDVAFLQPTQYNTFVFSTVALTVAFDTSGGVVWALPRATWWNLPSLTMRSLQVVSNVLLVAVKSQQSLMTDIQLRNVVTGAPLLETQELEIDPPFIANGRLFFVRPDFSRSFVCTAAWPASTGGTPLIPAAPPARPAPEPAHVTVPAAFEPVTPAPAPTQPLPPYAPPARWPVPKRAWAVRSYSTSGPPSAVDTTSGTVGTFDDDGPWMFASTNTTTGVQLWSVTMVICEKTLVTAGNGVTAFTCGGTLLVYDSVTGAQRWTFSRAVITYARVVGPVIIVEFPQPASHTASVVIALNITTGDVAWNTTLPCKLQNVAGAASRAAPTADPRFGVGYGDAAWNVFQCQEGGGHFVFDLAKGTRILALDSPAGGAVASSEALKTIAIVTLQRLTLFSTETGAVTCNHTFSFPGRVPGSRVAVVADASGHPVVLAVSQDSETVFPLICTATAVVSPWGLDSFSMRSQLGFVPDSDGYQFTAMAQTAADARTGDALVTIFPSVGSDTGVDWILRVNTITGAISANVSMQDQQQPWTMSAMPMFFSLPPSDAPARLRDLVFVQANTIIAALDFTTLKVRWTKSSDDITYGATPAWLTSSVNGNVNAVIGVHQSFTFSSAVVFGQPLAGPELAFVVNGALPLKTVTDGSGDIIGWLRTAPGEPFTLVRQRAFGPTPGSHVWGKKLPANVISKRSQMFGSFAKHTAVLSQTDGLVVISDVDGSVRTVTVSVLSRGCPFGKQEDDDFFIVGLSAGATATQTDFYNAPQFMGPQMDAPTADTDEAVLVVRAGPCYHFVSRNLRVVTHRPASLVDKNTQPLYFALHATTTRTSVLLVDSAKVLRVDLPVDFFTGARTTRTPAGAVIGMAIDHQLGSGAWIPSSSVVIDNTFVFASTTVIAAVDVVQEKLLWHFAVGLIGPSTTTITSPLRMYRGSELYVCTDSELFVLDPLTITFDTPLDRVVRRLGVIPNQHHALPRVPVAERFIIIMSQNAFIGYDVVEHNVTFRRAPLNRDLIPSGPVMPVPVAKTSAMYGLFVVSTQDGPTAVFDPTTGAEAVTLFGNGGGMSYAGTGAFCDHVGRCAVVVSVTGNYIPGTSVGIDLLDVEVSKAPAAVPPFTPPTSPTVPAGFEYRGPAPKMTAAAPFSTASIPSLDYELPGLTVEFVSTKHNVVVASLDKYLLRGLDASTGKEMWAVRLQSACLRGIFGSGTADVAVVATNCFHNGGKNTTVAGIDVTTGHPAFTINIANLTLADAFNRDTAYTGAVALPNTNSVCLAIVGPNSNQGVACYDTRDGAALITQLCSESPIAFATPLKALRPDPTLTTVVMLCRNYAAGIDPVAKSVVWNTTTANHLGQGETASLHPATLAAVTVWGENNTNAYVVRMVDTARRLVSNVFVNRTVNLENVRPLGTRHVAVQTALHGMVVDVASGKTLWSVISNTNCVDGTGCNVIALAADNATVVFAFVKSGDVVGFDLLTGAEKWRHKSLAPQTRYTAGVTLVASDVALPDVGAAVALFDGVINLYLIDASSGQVLWTTPTTTPVTTPWAFTKTCVLTSALRCYSLQPIPALVAADNIGPVTDVSQGGASTTLFAMDSRNIYTATLSANGKTATTVAKTPAFTSFSARSVAFFGGPRNTAAAVAWVGEYYWTMDTRTGAALQSFAMPDAESSASQRAMLEFSVAVEGPAPFGGVVFIPGELSSILALVSTSDGMKLHNRTIPTVGAVSFPLIRFTPSAEALKAFPQRQCGIIAVSGGRSIAVYDCTLMTPWWSAPSPTLLTGELQLAPVVTGDFMLLTAGGTTLSVSIVTGQVSWRAAVPPIVPVSTTGGWHYVVQGTDGTTTAFPYGETAPVQGGGNPVHGRPVWSRPLSRIVWVGTDRVITEGRTATNQVNFTCIDIFSGNQIWTRGFGNYRTQVVSGPRPVVNGTLLFAYSGTLAGLDVRTGNTTMTYSSDESVQVRRFSLFDDGAKVALTIGRRALLLPLVVTTAPLVVTRSTPIGLPDRSMPTLYSSDTAAPTLAPGTVIPSPGCVSRMATASAEFVECVDAVASPMWAGASWTHLHPPRAVFQGCPAVTASVKKCEQAYLEKMGAQCAVGASFLESGILPKLRATGLFGKCLAHAPESYGQCGDGVAAAQALCQALTVPPIVDGVPTLNGDESVPAGFLYPLLPPYMPTPQPPGTPGPSTAPTPSPGTPAPTPSPGTDGPTPRPTAAGPTPAPSPGSDHEALYIAAAAVGSAVVAGVVVGVAVLLYKRSKRRAAMPQGTELEDTINAKEYTPYEDEA